MPKQKPTRHQLVETRAAVREIRNAVEKILAAKAEMTIPLQSLAGIHAKTEPRSEFERIIFEVVRRGGSDAVTLGFACETAEIYCAEKIPAAASQERVMSIRSRSGAVSNIAKKMHRVSAIIDGSEVSA